MRDRDAKELARLLRIITEEDSRFIPQIAWVPFHHATLVPYVEVMIFRESAGILELLLTRRKEGDAEFPGRPWNIPGGRWIAGSSCEETANKVALDELGVGVTLLERSTFYEWLEHERGYPLSCAAICELQETIEESDEIRFFSTLPENMVSYPDDFLASATQTYRARKALHG